MGFGVRSGIGIEKGKVVTVRVRHVIDRRRGSTVRKASCPSLGVRMLRSSSKRGRNRSSIRDEDDGCKVGLPCLSCC
jgi:hypothetical protein